MRREDFALPLTRPLLFGLAVMGLAAATAGCTPKNKFQLGLPGSTVPVNVARVTPRGGVLDTELHGGGFAFRTFLPSTDVCARVVSKETGARWVAGAAHGSIERGSDRCDAVGIASLYEWRKRRGRPEGMRAIPSGTARYTKIYEDEEVAFLRGRFPLVGYLGWAGGEDTIAVVPKLGVCAKPLASDAATIEYFMTGKNVLTLSGVSGRCPIVGLIKPEAIAAGP
jgi:hypothetical protein